MITGLLVVLTIAAIVYLVWLVPGKGLIAGARGAALGALGYALSHAFFHVLKI
jgi:hypothetical protein